MKALLYLQPGKIALQSVAKPVLKDATDVIGRVVATTICGTDLHILKGDVPESTAVAEKQGGLILGHEAVIEVEQVGSAVTKFTPGDICLASCITSCGSCYYCKNKLQAHCSGNEGSSGWIFGHEINGTQAEFVRVPFGDFSLYKAPKGVSYESLLMLSDAMPTSYEIGVISGEVKKGDTVAIVGLGPVGLGALLTAKMLEPSQIIAIDMDDTRLELAKKFGATHTINPSKTKDVLAEINGLTTTEIKETGVDVAIEAVGVPATFEMCEDIIAPGGKIANVGVHGKPVQLNLQDLWIKNIKITTGLVSAYSTQELLDRVIGGQLDPSLMITHRMKFDEIEEGYKIFGNAAQTKAVKMLFTF